MIPIKDRVRCTKCANYERFYAHYNQPSNLIKMMVIQIRGEFFIIKPSVENFPQPGHTVNTSDKVKLMCPTCEEFRHLNYQEIARDRVIGYWKPELMPSLPEAIDNNGEDWVDDDFIEIKKAPKPPFPGGMDLTITQKPRKYRGNQQLGRAPLNMNKNRANVPISAEALKGSLMDRGVTP